MKETKVRECGRANSCALATVGLGEMSRYDAWEMKGWHCAMVRQERLCQMLTWLVTKGLRTLCCALAKRAPDPVLPAPATEEQAMGEVAWPEHLGLATRQRVGEAVRRGGTRMSTDASARLFRR